MKARTGKSMVGCVVRSRREFSNQLGVVPAGTLFRVKWMGRGLGLERDQPCQCCGLRFKVAGISPRDVEVVEEAQRPPLEVRSPAVKAADCPHTVGFGGDPPRCYVCGCPREEATR